MRLVYVDESYCNVCYYVVALLVPDTEAQALTTALNTVVRRATASYHGIGPTAELHGYDLFQGKGHWEPIKSMPQARIGVYDQALRAIADHNVTVVIRGVITQRPKCRHRGLPLPANQPDRGHSPLRALISQPAGAGRGPDRVPLPPDPDHF